MRNDLKEFELIRNNRMATILKAGKSQCLGNVSTDRHKIWCDDRHILILYAISAVNISNF